MTARGTKRVLVALGVVAGLVAGLGFAYRDTIQTMLVLQRLAPDHEFVDAPPPARPDYENPGHWAALPDRDDLADRVPSGEYDDRQATAPIDVFFIHPTTYYSSNSWNQPLDDTVTNELTDQAVMQGQASAFNGCCRVYAPRYRQATIYAFVGSGDNGPQALDLAYGDVVVAFRYYVAHFNDGRPFVLAAHSQGSRHADLLIADEITGTPLAERMIAAYPVGFGLDGTNGVPVCQDATETGCQITWNSVGPDVTSPLATAGHICVNPLSWRADETRAGFETNFGGVSFGAGGMPEPGVADAQCRDGNLVVSEIRSEHYASRPLGRDNYHLYDYALFYLNIRENVAARVDAFLRDNRPHDTSSP